MAGRMEIRALTESRDKYAKAKNATLLDDATGIRSDLDRAIQLYAESRGRPETSPDILRGEGLHTEVAGREDEGRGRGSLPRSYGSQAHSDGNPCQ